MSRFRLDICFAILVLCFVTYQQALSVASLDSNSLNSEQMPEDNYADGHAKRTFSHEHDYEDYGRDQIDREALFGSRKAVKEYEEKSPEEAREMLTDLVTQKGMDADGNGNVTLDELTNWVERSFKSLRIEDGIERFDDEDLNADGQVTWEEHLQDNYPTSKESMDVADGASDLIREDELIWKAADKNGDNILNRNEFVAFNAPEEFPHTLDAFYAAAMERRDKDKDDYLSFVEFITDELGSVPDHDSETFITEKDRFTNDYDLDKDGQLNREEVLLWLAPGDREAALAEATHLISSVDANNDGQLSHEEILNNYEFFTGSEMKDFSETANELKDEL